MTNVLGKRTNYFIRLLFLFISIMLLSCKHIDGVNNSGFEKSIDTIKYDFKGFNIGIKLYLLSNETFYYENYGSACMGGGESEKVYGKYKNTQTDIQLYPDSLKIVIIPYNRHDKPIISKQVYGSDSLRIKTHYKIISRDSYEYLISEEPSHLFRNWLSWYREDFKNYNMVKRNWNDYYELAYFINTGLEPQSQGMYLRRKLNSDTNSTKIKIGLSEIDTPWKSLFLEQPITAQIKKVTKIVSKEESDYYILEIDKGSNQGIQLGVVIFNRKDFNDHIEIVDVFPDKSIGYCYKNEKEIRVGDTVKTKWE